MRTDGEYETKMKSFLVDRGITAVRPALDAYIQVISLAGRTPVDSLPVESESDDGLASLAQTIISHESVNAANEWATQTQDSLL